MSSPRRRRPHPLPRLSLLDREGVYDRRRRPREDDLLRRGRDRERLRDFLLPEPEPLRDFLRAPDRLRDFFFFGGDRDFRFGLRLALVDAFFFFGGDRLRFFGGPTGDRLFLGLEDTFFLFGGDRLLDRLLL